MGITLKNTLKTLPKSRRKKITARAQELVALEMTLRELRRARQITQEQLAELLGIGQDSVSRLESRPDFKLSTLQNYVHALGGTLRIVADFPDSETVEVVGIGDGAQ